MEHGAESPHSLDHENSPQHQRSAQHRGRDGVPPGQQAGNKEEQRPPPSRRSGRPNEVVGPSRCDGKSQHRVLLGRRADDSTVQVDRDRSHLGVDVTARPSDDLPKRQGNCHEPHRDEEGGRRCGHRPSRPGCSWGTGKPCQQLQRRNPSDRCADEVAGSARVGQKPLPPYLGPPLVNDVSRVRHGGQHAGVDHEMSTPTDDAEVATFPQEPRRSGSSAPSGEPHHRCG